MGRDETLRILRMHEADLRGHGVRHAALFGSVARDEAHADSDVDVLVDIDPGAEVSLWDLVGIRQMIEVWLKARVDIVSEAGLKPRMRDLIERDAIYAF